MFEISATKLDAYLTCPLKYRFRYVDKIEPEAVSAALAFGSAVHGTIKHFYKRLMEGRKLTMEELQAAFIEDFEIQTAVPIKLNKKTLEEMQQQGTEMIRAYFETVNDPVVPLAVEQEYRAPLINLDSGEVLEDIELIGILDRVDPDNMPVEIKTAASSWSQMSADQSLQMSLYSYMLAFHSEAKKINGRFEVIVKNKVPKIQTLNTVRRIHDFDQLFRTVKHVVYAVHEGIFYPSRSYLCPSCDYCYECYKW